MTTPKPDSPNIVVPPLLAFFFFLICGVSAWFAYGGTLSMIPWPFRWLPGGFLAVAGVLFMRAGFERFRRLGVTVRTVKPASELVTSGAYRFSRNPMYAGFVAVLGGAGWFFGAIPMLVSAVLMFFYLARLVIPREEAYLARSFGEEYRAYCAAVRRWV